MSIHSLCGGFAKTKRGCHKKNDMTQSHHFSEIATVTGKVSKNARSQGLLAFYKLGHEKKVRVLILKI